MRESVFRSVSFIALSIMLSSCGGGGTAPRPATPAPLPAAPPPAPVIPASDFETAEYDVDWSLDAINASQAYSKGFTGEGALVGFVDFNFEFDNDEVAWVWASADRDQQWVDMYEAYLGVSASPSHHGHWVSSIAAAKKNNYAMQGVAFDAEVLAVDFFSGVDMYTEVDGGVTYYVSDPWSYVVNNGARVVGKSIGYDEEDFIAAPPAGGTTDVNGDGIAGNEHYVTTNAAVVIELGGLLVAAAGNDGDPEPMVSNLDTLEDMVTYGLMNGDGYFIIAGSSNSQGMLSYFSDRAGTPDVNFRDGLPYGFVQAGYEVMDFYLLAPGEDVAVNWAGSDDGIGIGSGTSYAAPHIVGAAAMLFGKWPHLTGREVAAILFNSATDMGAPGVDPIYGHGLLNLDAATQPLGTVSMAINSAVGPVSLGDSMISLGSAFGDASPMGLSNVMILDSYNRDFYVDMSQQVMAASTGLNLGDRLAMDIRTNGGMWQIGRGLEMGFTTHRSAVSDTIKLALSYDQQATVENQVQSWHLRGSDGHKNSWAMGSGAALSDVMTSFTSGSGPSRQFYLTGHQAFGPATSNSYYMASDTVIAKDLHLSFGYKSGSLKGYENHPLELYRQDLPAWEMESRLSKDFDKGSLSFALGALIEKQAVLGSRSGGGLKLASDTRTLKADIFATFAISSSLNLTAQGHVGQSQVKAAANSLFAGVNDFLSSSWSVELSGANIFASGDMFGFKLSQPLRVENAHATMQAAAYFDYALKAPVYVDRQISFSPTSREIAAEFGYKKTVANWVVEVNVAERFNAGHAKGLYDTVGLLRIARNF